ncbi:MAG: site-2 protease family protein [Rhodospirillales bacterium]|nr:site-2 protease family protein [Rhodospirillales bacterium]
MFGDPAGLLYQISVWVLPVVTAITLHEAAHGWVAWKLGDNTAKQLGRVTFNPIVHTDKFGTVLLPGLLLLTGAPFLFGYAKPVPVNFRQLHRPRQDMIWVAAAGPGINLLMAFSAAVLLHLVPLLPAEWAQWTSDNLRNALIINVVLAVFNMLPLLPLDGGRVMTGLLPTNLARPYARTERYGMLIIIALIALPPLIGQQIGQPLNVLGWILGPPVQCVINVVLMLAGQGS